MWSVVISNYFLQYYGVVPGSKESSLCFTWFKCKVWCPRVKVSGSEEYIICATDENPEVMDEDTSGSYPKINN